MKDRNVREWFPWEAQGAGVIRSAICQHTVDPYPSMSTDDWEIPAVHYEPWGAAENFTPDELFAVAREADRRSLVRKPYSLAMACIHLVRTWKEEDRTDRYVVIDGEKIDLNDPSFREKYLEVPGNMDSENSHRYCRSCPRKKDLCASRDGDHIVLKPLAKSGPEPENDHDRLAWCTSASGDIAKKHGDCMLPSFAVVGEK